MATKQRRSYRLDLPPNLARQLSAIGNGDIVMGISWLMRKTLQLGSWSSYEEMIRSAQRQTRRPSPQR